MDIKKAIGDCAIPRIRSVAKNEAIYDSAQEASDAESSAKSAKDAKGFDKLKKECLTSVQAGEKAVKPWEAEMEAWDKAIKNLENEIAAEKEKIAQQQKEADAVSKTIDEINADIQAYNDSLILKSRDPRARPLIAKKDSGAKLLAATAALNQAAALAKEERDTWNNQKQWVSKPIDKLKEIKDRVSKSKFTPPKK